MKISNQGEENCCLGVRPVVPPAAEERHAGNRHYYFSLIWMFQFPDQDTCDFAHYYPYTSNNLQEYLVAISKGPVASKFCKVHILCCSLGKGTQQKAAIVTVRVHPGGTKNSWVTKGFMDFILGDSSKAQLLRDNFVLKAVLIFNPGGLIVENHLCILTGQDMVKIRKEQCLVLQDIFSIFLPMSSAKICLSNSLFLSFSSFLAYSHF
uniref:Uncharacterized protein n=1 Tax=Geospiza parvula TaxID=87175 RepID=A0A8C3N2R4_GEOPR